MYIIYYTYFSIIMYECYAVCMFWCGVSIWVISIILSTSMNALLTHVNMFITK